MAEGDRREAGVNRQARGRDPAETQERQRHVGSERVGGAVHTQCIAGGHAHERNAASHRRVQLHGIRAAKLVHHRVAVAPEHREAAGDLELRDALVWKRPAQVRVVRAGERRELGRKAIELLSQTLEKEKRFDEIRVAAVERPLCPFDFVADARRQPGGTKAGERIFDV